MIECLPLNLLYDSVCHFTWHMSRKQEKINVQLNVKVDPEETEHWLEPGEVVQEDDDTDLETLESTSDG